MGIFPGASEMIEGLEGIKTLLLSFSRRASPGLGIAIRESLKEKMVFPSFGG